MMRWKDGRVKGTNEAVSNMQIIKTFVWESFFYKKIDQVFYFCLVGLIM